MKNHNCHIENKGLFFCKDSTLLNHYVALLWVGGWVRDVDRTFVKKRYGKTRVGGFFILCKSYVRLPFFIPCFLMEYEFFRPVIIHMSAVRIFSYGFAKVAL